MIPKFERRDSLWVPQGVQCERAFNFNRRPGERNNRGRVSAPRGGGAATFGPLDPLTIVTGVNNVFWLIGDLGITLGTGVSSWANQGPTGATGNATQGTGAAQPSYNATELNGHGVLTFDSTDDTMQFASLDLPNPSVTPIWFWMAFQMTTWTNADRVYAGAGTTSVSCRQVTASPQISCSNGVAGPTNSGAPLNTWTRLEQLFTFDVTDYIKLASTNATGTNTGSGNPAAGTFYIASNGTANFGGLKCAAFGCWDDEPSAGVKSALDTWATGYFGGLVAI